MRKLAFSALLLSLGFLTLGSHGAMADAIPGVRAVSLVKGPCKSNGTICSAVQNNCVLVEPEEGDPFYTGGCTKGGDGTAYSAFCEDENNQTCLTATDSDGCGKKWSAQCSSTGSCMTWAETIYDQPSKECP